MTEINPRIVDGEPVCHGMECSSYKKVENSDMFECGKVNPHRLVRKGIPCLPGLRQQRDELRARAEEAKAERDALKREMGRRDKIRGEERHGFLDRINELVKRAIDAETENVELRVRVEKAEREGEK